jgi:Uncharacterized ABC-type transport system, permease component
MIDRITSLCLSCLGTAAPLAVAALGGLATQAAGSLSIALEGSMIAGAFAAAAAAKVTGSALLGLAAGSGAGLALSLLVAASSLGLGADVFVAGLAANLLAPGLASVLSQAAYGTKGVLSSPALRLGEGSLLALGGIAVVFLAIVLSRSVLGLRLRASGEGDEIAAAAGLSSRRYRLVAQSMAGASAGLAGAMLAAGIGAYVPGMATGRGWIALVAIFLGAGRAGGTILACLLFGVLFAAANLAQGLSSSTGGLASASELLQALPYLATLVALLAWRKSKGSASGDIPKSLRAERRRPRS